MQQDAAMDPVQEPIDPDLEPDTTPSRTPRLHGGQLSVVGVVAAGGGIGAAARHGAGVIWPTGSGAFPLTTLLINVTGCALIGVLLVLIVEVWVAHRLVRPFLGTGVLGGYTTFSTYALDVERLVEGGDVRTGLIYLVLTPVLSLVAVWLTVAATRRLVERRLR